MKRKLPRRNMERWLKRPRGGLREVRIRRRAIDIKLTPNWDTRRTATCQLRRSADVVILTWYQIWNRHIRAIKMEKLEGRRPRPPVV
jgi:hypothetical protein